MCSSRGVKLVLIAIMIVVLFAAAAFAVQDREIQWIEGPTEVNLGSNLAKVMLEDGYAFAGPDDTRYIMEQFGNPPTNAEVGMIIPKSETLPWFIIFDHYSVGYVPDDEKNNIDAAGTLKSYSKGTEKSNKQREKMGFKPIHVAGWYEEPRYDELTHNLTWAMLLESEDGQQTVNYEIRILGRGGYMSATMVTDPESLAMYKKDINNVIANFAYKPGNKYAEFVQGDKIAKYGLNALMLGGAAAVATKLGFFKVIAKAWKAIVVAIVALFSVIARFFRGIFSTEEKSPMSYQK